MKYKIVSTDPVNNIMGPTGSYIATVDFPAYGVSSGNEVFMTLHPVSKVLTIKSQLSYWSLHENYVYEFDCVDLVGGHWDSEKRDLVRNIDVLDYSLVEHNIRVRIRYSLLAVKQIPFVITKTINSCNTEFYKSGDLNAIVARTHRD